MADYEALCKVYLAGPCNEPNLVAFQIGEPEGVPGPPVTTADGRQAFPTPEGPDLELWVTAPPGKEREFLAVAIAAITGDRKIYAGIKNVARWGQINAMYLNTQSVK